MATPRKAAASKKSAAPRKTSARKAPARAPRTTRTSTPTGTVPAASDAPASTVTDRPPDAAPVQMGAVVETPEAVAARETLTGRKKWGTGRDRDANLRAAGLDPAVVARERNRLRHEPQS